MAMRRRGIGGLALGAASFVALAPATTQSRGGPLGPGIQLQGGTHALTGKALTFTATTDASLAGAGGHFALEFRGIDLARSPRATYARPDYRDPRPCKVQPCSWSVNSAAAVTYEFRALLIDVRSGKSVGQSQPLRAVWEAPQPRALKLLFNGKRLPLSALDGPDDYKGVPAGRLQVEARWTTDARGTGYSVVISTTEPQKWTYATCSTGTSCRVPQKVPIAVNQEMSWNVTVLAKSSDKVVKAFKVCLVGRA